MNQSLVDLPDDVREIIEPETVKDSVTLDAIGVAIGAKRDEAKTERQSSGIEDTWKECEEAYIGIDDANRHEFGDARWAKPMSMSGPVTTGSPPRGMEHKSTAFVRLTSRYVDAGTAKLGEILLPADDKAFSFSETPVPDLIKAKDDTSQVFHEGLGVPLTRPAAPGDAAAPQAPQPAAMPALAGALTGVAAPGVPPVAPGAPAMPVAPAAPQAAPQVPVTVSDFALEAIEIARKKAKAAETRIYDWMVECQYQAEMRKVIHDAARIGTGILKAPTPKFKRVIAVETSNGKIEVIIKEKLYPSANWVDPWNIFPDPASGENIHNGDYVFERDFMSERQVRDLKKSPGYVADQIDKVIAEGPDKAKKDGDQGAGGKPGQKKQKNRYEIWYFYGALTRDEIGAIDKAAGKPDVASNGADQVYAIVTLINDSVVRATINPLDSGSFPYHSISWQRRAGHWAGVGVAEQLRMPQKTINAATRALLNNAGKSSGSQIVVDQGAIIPADGNWTITPDKIWFKRADSEGTDVRQAFQTFEVPNTTEPLMKIVEYALQLAEESTSIPLVTQGQTGPTTPDTLGATNIQNNNANQLLRSIGYAFDDNITEPVVRQFYEWLLIDPDVPDEEKGEFTINAHGSIALVERAIQDQTIAQMEQMVANPIYGMDPKKWARLFLKSKRLVPEDVQYTEEEQAKIDAAPPPDPPPVAVAKIQAQTAATQLAATQTAQERTDANEQQIAEAAATLDGARVQNDAKRVEAEQQRTLTESTVKLHEIQVRHDMALLDYANRHSMSIAQAKTELAKTAMQLNTEQQLNAENNAAGDRKHRREMRQQQRPPVQVPGRAANGHGFDQSA